MVALGRRTGLGAYEALAFGHLDEVIQEAVEDAVAAMADIDLCSSDEGFDFVNDPGGVLQCRQWRCLVPVHLIGVEDVAGAGHEAFALFTLAAFLLFFSVELSVKDHQAGFLALVDLTALILPLAIGAPGTGREAACLCGGPEADDVDPTIGAGSVDIGGAVQALAGAVPGHLPVTGSSFDGSDDAVVHLGVNVLVFGLHGLSPCLCERLG